MPTLTKNIFNALNMIGVSTAFHALAYSLRKPWAEARWGTVTPQRGWPTAWMTPGHARYVQPHARGATLHAEHGSIEVRFLAADLVRVRCWPKHQSTPEPIPYAIDKALGAWPVPPIVPIHTERAVLLCSAALIVGITLSDSKVFIANADGQLLRADIDMAYSPNGCARHRVALAPDEHIFGLGERATPGNRRGHVHILWNTDPAGYANGDDPINLNIPVYVGMMGNARAEAKKEKAQPPTSQSYLAFYENPTYAEFNLDSDGTGIADHRFAGGELRYYVAAGPVPRLLARYTELTGRHALPPLWMLGYQQSRWSYYPEARVRKLAQDFKAHNVPCDAVYLDIDYMDGFRCFTVDQARFPNLPQLAKDLEAQGIKLVSMIDPAIKKDKSYAIYQSGLKGDHFCKTPDGKVYHAPVWAGPSAFPDFTNPQTRAWWGQLYRPLVNAGIAGFWNDMNEPAAFAVPNATTLPDPVRHSLEGDNGSHAEAHNVYGMQMARASYEGLRKLQPDTRPVVITRAGWAGVQRYATSWTGDNASTWDALRLTVPMVIGLGLSGLGFTGSDIGGFTGEADGELFTRWIQMGAFMPFFRAHTAKGFPDQAPWSYGEPYLRITRRFIELRYELLPYLYTATWQLHARGWPMVRPLWWQHQSESALWDVHDAFLCGDALLVAPVGEPGASTRPVTFPTGTWYDFWTNTPQTAKAPQQIACFAPLETLPLFVREGTVLPMGESGPSTEQRKDKFLRLGVYPLDHPGTCTSELYEDAGEGFDADVGMYRHSRFVVEQDAARLHIRWQKEGPYQPPYAHIELTLNGLPRVPRAITVDGESYKLVTADPVRHTVLLGIPPFEELDIRL